ncbi:MAG: AMP-binding protein [Proteobacteria bacterium]|nr:AMP-binding protein [Pseudomonadota bacterium]
MDQPTSRTLPDLLDETAGRFTVATAVVGLGRRLSFAELRDQSRTFSNGLAKLGIGHGDHVALLMQNRPEWLIAYFGITALGAVAVAINTWATAHELEYMLAHSGARAGNDRPVYQQ